MKIEINTNTPRLHSFLIYETPDGVEIISPRPMEYKSIDFDVSIDIILNIDVFKISALILSTWLAKRLINQRGNHKLNINGKQIAIDQAKIQNELQKAIDDKET
jgi:hypothetical protein